MKITIEFIDDPELGMGKLNTKCHDPMSLFMALGLLEAAKMDLYSQMKDRGQSMADEFLINAIGKSIEPENKQ